MTLPPAWGPPPPSASWGQPPQPPPAWLPDELSQPLYGAGPGEAVSRFFRKYADFSGRASLSEFWWVQLVLCGVLAALYALALVAAAFSAGSGSGAAGGMLAVVVLLVMLLVCLGLVVPQYALIWRRLHDANLAGPMYFLSMVPFVGSLVLTVLLALPSNPAGRRFDSWR